MPSRKRSRSERCRLGPDPVIMWMSLLGDELVDDEVKNLVGLKCCWDSFSEWDGDDVLKLKFVLVSGERCWCCLGELSSRDVAIWADFRDSSEIPCKAFSFRLTSSIDCRLRSASGVVLKSNGSSDKRYSLIDVFHNHRSELVSYFTRFQKLFTRASFFS